jgi:hypothetical protein
MNLSHLPLHRPASLGWQAALASLSFSAAFAAAPASSASANAAPKTHVLFMGADIAVERDKTFHRVEDVTPVALVIKPGGGKPVIVPQSPTLNLGISDALKLADTSVAVDKLTSERTYTPGADPFRDLARTATLAAGESAVADLANGSVIRANMAVMAASNAVATAQNPYTVGQAQQMMADAQAQRSAAEASFSSAINAPAIQALDVSGRSVVTSTKDMQEMFDAIRVSFELTPERDLGQPYYALIAQIREPGSKPGQVRKWAYVKSLDALTAGVAKKVTIFQGGLPPGYIIESCEVHLYNRGEEVATNLSRKRVPLTDAEAQDYRIIDYVGANKGRTLPAVPVTATLAASVRAPLTLEQLNGSYYVRVAKDGRVVAAFRDAAGKQPVTDPALEAALKTLRFKPALDAGKPIEALVAFDLGQSGNP